MAAGEFYLATMYLSLHFTLHSVETGTCPFFSFLFQKTLSSSDRRRTASAAPHKPQIIAIIHSLTHYSPTRGKVPTIMSGLPCKQNYCFHSCLINAPSRCGCTLDTFSGYGEWRDFPPFRTFRFNPSFPVFSWIHSFSLLVVEVAYFESP